MSEIQMPAEAIAELFARADATSNAIHRGMQWNVLTALRGPDNKDEILKHIFTNRIRALALPEMQWPSPRLRRDDPSLRPTDVQRLPNIPYNVHFGEHVSLATIALHYVGVLSLEELDFIIDLLGYWRGSLTFRDIVGKHGRFIDESKAPF